jgi:hypothetical protein
MLRGVTEGQKARGIAGFGNGWCDEERQEAICLRVEQTG